MPDAPLLDLVVRLRDHVADPADGLADADLLQRYVRERDAVAFEALVWRHARLVMGVCRRALRHRQDAEDAFQATFLLLARKAQRIRRGAALPAWLHTTAVRVAGRARKRRLARPAELPEVLIDDVPPELREAGTVLDDAIRRLPARLRTAFVMCELEGRTHADAARELGCPKGTIDSRMAAARRRLRDRLVRRGITLSPAIIVGTVGNEWALGELPRQMVACIHGSAAKLPSSVTNLAMQSSMLSHAKLLDALIIVATLGTTVAIGNWNSTNDQPGASNEKSKEPEKRPADGKQSSLYAVGTNPSWKRTTIGVEASEDFNFEQSKAPVEWLSKLFAKVIDERHKAGRHVIPPAVPVIVGDQVVYNCDRGWANRSLVVDKSADPPITVGERLWLTDVDAWTVVTEGVYRAQMSNWFPEGKPSSLDAILYRTLVGSTVTNGRFVTFVDEMTIPTPLNVAISVEEEKAKGWRDKKYEAFGELISGNELRVVDHETGKVNIVLKRTLKPTEVGPFGANLYLAVPLPLDDLSVLLHERDKSISLTCISWEKIRKDWAKLTGNWNDAMRSSANKTFLWNTELAQAQTSVVADPHRRIHAIHLTKANDLILCPTHLGRVVAVEAKTGKIRWTHEYAPLDAKRFPTFAPEWVVVPPVVVGDKYVYAPADFPELLCLNVADGKKVWSVKKDDGLYPAVVGEQVLVIGSKTLRSLSLKDGSEQWKLDLPGLPCGRGAMLGDTYLLPFSEPKTWKGMIAIVDPKAGKIIEVLKPEKDEPIGNLVVHQDFLISQTLTEIAAFPIKKKE